MQTVTEPDSLIRSLQLVDWKAIHHVPQRAFEDLRSIIPNVSIPEPCAAIRIVQDLIGLPPPQYVDCCANNCILFHGSRSQMTHCFCGASRYRNFRKRDGSVVQKPVNQMRYFLLIGRIIQLWANSAKAKLWKDYRLQFQQYRHHQTSLDNYWSGDLHKNYHYSDLGMFHNAHDMAFQ